MTPMTSEVALRDMTADDLPIFFEQQLDPTANTMAAFTMSKDPTDRDAFMARWEKMLGDTSRIRKTILFDGQVAGNILGFELFGQPTIGYWLGKEYWGKGIATRAVAAFLDQLAARPVYARVAKDNVASRRVLEKCGFAVVGEDRGFANARDAEVEEFILRLAADEPDDAR